MSKKTTYESICIKCESMIAYNRSEKPLNCPYCGYGNGNYEWKKPQTETELFIIQNKYLKNRDPKYLNDLYLVLLKYAEGKIKKILNGSIYYDAEKLQEKAHDAATQFIEYYLKKPNFKVDFSFGGFLSWQIKSVLWNKTDQDFDKTFSLNSMIDSSSNKEKIELGNFKPLFSEFDDDEDCLRSNIARKVDLVNGIEIIISDIINKLRSEYSTAFALKVLIGIKNYILGTSDEDKELYYNHYGRYDVKDYVEKSMMLIYSFIQGNY